MDLDFFFRGFDSDREKRELVTLCVHFRSYGFDSSSLHPIISSPISAFYPLHFLQEAAGILPMFKPLKSHT
ncbi:hypothetical protein L6164_037171 [Bauhinia variegata]|uniref:Uncharacterized protein n=1 Tax=Bauhinia variegata TaxID=167791 RepID=A0ACB9KJD2_BAUVA|nr:hypothetical protein L6164_037171 [Bauhinia variegata]